MKYFFLNTIQLNYRGNSSKLWLEAIFTFCLVALLDKLVRTGV